MAKKRCWWAGLFDKHDFRSDYLRFDLNLLNNSFSQRDIYSTKACTYYANSWVKVRNYQTSTFPIGEFTKKMAAKMVDWLDTMNGRC